MLVRKGAWMEPMPGQITKLFRLSGNTRVLGSMVWLVKLWSKREEMGGGGQREKCYLKGLFYCGFKLL